MKRKKSATTKSSLKGTGRKRSKKSFATGKVTTSGAIGVLKDVALLAVGVVGGNAISKAIEKKNATGTDLLGLSGDASSYVSAGVPVVVGGASALLAKQRWVKTIGMGALLAGGVKAVNKVTGKQVVALGDAGSSDVVLPNISGVPAGTYKLPGVGGTMNNLYNTGKGLPTTFDYGIDPELSRKDIRGVNPELNAQVLEGIF
jgi:hypothetical protein